MSRPQHDYTTLRQEYITADPQISVRELCRKHEIKSWSTVNKKKNDEKWDDLREQYRTRLAEGEVGSLVQARLKEIAEIHGELLLAVRAGVRRYITAVTDDKNPQDVSTRDLQQLIDKFLLLAGSTPNRSESRSIDTHSFTFDGLLEGAPTELLRELAELAERRGSGGHSVGRGPLVLLEGASKEKVG